MADNYRHVCHLIELGKLVELVVWDQLLGHCVDGGLLHPHHHGSNPNQDCVTALGNLQDAVTRAAEEKLLAGRLAKPNLFLVFLYRRDIFYMH